MAGLGHDRGIHFAPVENVHLHPAFADQHPHIVAIAIDGEFRTKVGDAAVSGIDREWALRIMDYVEIGLAGFQRDATAGRGDIGMDPGGSVQLHAAAIGQAHRLHAAHAGGKDLLGRGMIPGQQCATAGKHGQARRERRQRARPGFLAQSPLRKTL